MKHGKKYQEAAKAIDRMSLYDSADAFDLVKKSSTAKFDETVEVHIRTGCDGRHADQQIRGAVVLPNGTGKQVRVLVFAKGEKEKIKAYADQRGESLNGFINRAINEAMTNDNRRGDNISGSKIGQTL